MSHLDVHQFICRDDNYGVLVHDTVTGTTISIDAPDARAVADNLKSILDSQREIQSSITRRNEQSVQAQSAINEAIAREQEWMAQINEAPAVEVAPAPAAPCASESRGCRR